MKAKRGGKVKGPTTHSEMVPSPRQLQMDAEAGQDMDILAAALSVGSTSVVTGKQIEAMTKFVSSIMEHGKIAKAAIDAGYPKSSAQRMGRVLLDHPVVQQLIREQQQSMVRKMMVTPERVWAELERMAFFEPGALFKDGSPIPIEKLPSEVARMVTGYKSKVTEFGEGGRSEEVEVKWVDKSAALRELEKLQGMVKDEGTLRLDANDFLKALYEGRERATKREQA